MPLLNKAVTAGDRLERAGGQEPNLGGRTPVECKLEGSASVAVVSGCIIEHLH